MTQLILLHEDDNVLVVVAPVEVGDMLTVAGGTVPAREGITVGHKVARHALRGAAGRSTTRPAQFGHDPKISAKIFLAGRR